MPIPEACSRSIRATAKNLEQARKDVEEIEKRLQKKVAAVVSAHKDGLRDWARSIGISAQYACDIRYGRRKISAQLLEKILR